MEATTAAAAPGFWRRMWNTIQVVEMSSGEHQDLRIDRLERRVAALEKMLQADATTPSELSGIPVQRA